ncbi:hypothetical protein BATDEDRAFT_87189 [Batrachochytrium dendrobatidis JAM81]|uniref:Uncharacterized protein n=2 Tax=Batrachochytrium dendrobatidis TaxID=109871 RepID=F4NYB5_BATDJ|nr:uncharacterized protein BATDEDRAFT_87189 [Batrachochytrium dendrobatidis JAM81]EGF81994.1 hypothetical protein BATDEDRAFT_87189 [Batrachochytrium dendrobatidis JAM81]OAJ43880.1 hypothetical protein BDEG_27193 [Batrachochytrium dendrobatidis JEL423]|eukprot:XP_006677597.1 hypothetical protein BATDEDRAFT_87189 [Batrachochytrium dendrobatidis JAM81]
MKLVDILLLLTAAATANAILIPTDNNGSLQASVTSSQVSVSTNEPSPGTSNEYQEEPVDLSLPGRIRQGIMDQLGLNTPTQGQQPTATVTGPSTFKQGRKRIMDVIDLLISRQNQQRPIDEVDPNASKQSQQQPMDQPNPSTSKRSRKRPINEISPSIFSQASGSTNEPSPSAPKRDRKQPIDQPIPSTSSQDQQQPINEGESANTSSNQVTELSPRYQRTFDGIKQRLVESKIVQKKKHKKYWDYEAIGLEHQLALERGEDISGSTYDPDTEKKLKQEYRDAGARVWELRHQLKKFMKRRGLKFEEPN